jgi:hypothetical protein
MARRRKLLILLGGALAAVLLGIVAFWHASLRIPQEPFVSHTWLTEKDLSLYRRFHPSKRQRMIADLMTNGLPGRERTSIEALLGRSVTPAEMKRPTMSGYYFDNLDWDLIYPIGRERIFIFDHRGIEFSPDTEYLILRLDENGVFESWFIYGSHRWPDVVGDPGRANYRSTR